MKILKSFLSYVTERFTWNRIKNSCNLSEKQSPTAVAIKTWRDPWQFDFISGHFQCSYSFNKEFPFSLEQILLVTCWIVHILQNSQWSLFEIAGLKESFGIAGLKESFGIAGLKESNSLVIFFHWTTRSRSRSQPSQKSCHSGSSDIFLENYKACWENAKCGKSKTWPWRCR